MTREEIASYYDRRPGVNGEFATPEDKANEAEVAERIARRWDLQLNDWGDWAPLDRWAERDERPTGVLEIKCRPILSTKYPCAWLNWAPFIDTSAAACSTACYVFAASRKMTRTFSACLRKSKAKSKPASILLTPS